MYWTDISQQKTEGGHSQQSLKSVVFNLQNPNSKHGHGANLSLKGHLQVPNCPDWDNQDAKIKEEIN